MLPGSLVIAALYWLYAAQRGLPLFGALVAGLSLAVLMLVAKALWRLGRRVLRSALPAGLAALALPLIALGVLLFPLLLLGALVFGGAAGSRWPAAFAAATAPAAA